MDHPLLEALSMMGKRAGNVFSAVMVDNPLGVTGSAHGIRKGWFNWPLNFDPVWLESCDGFEERESCSKS